MPPDACTDGLEAALEFLAEADAAAVQAVKQMGKVLDIDAPVPRRFGTCQFEMNGDCYRVKLPEPHVRLIQKCVEENPDDPDAVQKQVLDLLIKVHAAAEAAINAMGKALEGTANPGPARVTAAAPADDPGTGACYFTNGMCTPGLTYNVCTGLPGYQSFDPGHDCQHGARKKKGKAARQKAR